MFVSPLTTERRAALAGADRHTRVAIVTGTAGDRTEALVARLMADGMTVVVNQVAHHPAYKAPAVESRNAAGSVYACQADVAAESEVRALFAYAEAAFGGIDVVVHSVAALPSASPGLTTDELDQIHRSIIRGAFLVNRQAARQVRPGGAIVNVSTCLDQSSLADYRTFVAMKGVVDSLTLMLARELRGRDITVNAVAPGSTAMDEPAGGPGPDQDVVDGVAHLSSTDRLGTSADLADTVSFLAGPARWLSGQILDTHGGAATQLTHVSRRTQPIR